MPEPTKEEIAPLFEAYGAACFEAQHFEGSLKLLLMAVNEYEKINIPQRTIREIDTEEAEKTLGKLFRKAQEKEFFTEAERKMINRAIKERNFLVHSYWNKRMLYALQPEGRRWLIDDMDKIREIIRSATAIINSLIDRYLGESGASVQDFADRTNDFWESDSTLPPELLH